MHPWLGTVVTGHHQTLAILLEHRRDAAVEIGHQQDTRGMMPDILHPTDNAG